MNGWQQLSSPPAFSIDHSLGAARWGIRLARDSSLGLRAALWGVNEIVGLTLASLLAGFATTPYAAYHFHRLAAHGVLVNPLASSRRQHSKAGE